MPSPVAKRVVLGVTGGIAAYKSAELVRLYRKAGWEVRVVMTKQAENFVGALTFASLSGNPVLRSLDSAENYDLSATSHIDLAQWGDIFVVAPATANFIAKYSAGICDDALSTEALAFRGPVLIAPAMNTRMWEAPVTRENCTRLGSRGVHFVGPVRGDLACGETGAGKMAEPADIFAASQTIFGEQPELPLSGKHVLITSGPTRAYIDPVRFITNRSSGRMGHAIAQAAEALGARVTLVTGPVEDKYTALRSGGVVRVETNQQMLDAALSALPEANLVVAAAAVADFEMGDARTVKIERKSNLNLELSASQDILATLTQARKPGQIFVAFAAENGGGDAQKDRARAKLERKGADFVVLNDISRTDIGFDVDSNEVHIFSKKYPEKFLPRASKAEIARSILMLAMESGA